MQPNIPSGIIDFHVHLFPPQMFESVRRAFVRDYNWDVVYKMDSHECIDYLKERSVKKIVYSNYAHRPGVAGGMNEWNIKMLDESEDVYCFAAFHPEDPDAAGMVRDVLSHPKVLGIKLQLLVQRFYPDDERLFEMYESVMESGKYILFHVGTGPVGNEFVGLKYFRRLLERYPQLPGIVAHMGAYEYEGFMSLLDEHENLFLDTAFAFFREFEGKGAFNLGPGALEKYKYRILYGSDFPNLIMPRESELETLSGYGLSKLFYERVFFENGCALIEKTRGVI